MRKRLGAEEAIEVVADKWFVLIVAELRSGKKRHGELRNAIPGISPRMLTVTLRKMERDGLVERTVYPVVPPRTEYALTELGRTLLGPLRELSMGGASLRGCHETSGEGREAVALSGYRGNGDRGWGRS